MTDTPEPTPSPAPMAPIVLGRHFDGSPAYLDYRQHFGDSLWPLHVAPSPPPDPLGVGELRPPRPDWMEPKQPHWLSKVNRDVDVNANIDTFESPALPDPYTVPAHRVAEVESWLRANKARALNVFRHGDNTEEVVRARIAELFGPVSESGMLTAPADSIGATLTGVGGAAAPGLSAPHSAAPGTAIGLLGEVGRGKGALIKRMPTTPQNRVPGADRRLP